MLGDCQFLAHAIVSAIDCGYAILTYIYIYIYIHRCSSNNMQKQLAKTICFVYPFNKFYSFSYTCFNKPIKFIKGSTTTISTLLLFFFCFCYFLFFVLFCLALVHPTTVQLCRRRWTMSLIRRLLLRSHQPAAMIFSTPSLCFLLPTDCYCDIVWPIFSPT